MSRSYRIKYVDADGRHDRVPVLCCGSDDPPLLAVANALLMKADIRLPRHGDDMVTVDDLTNVLMTHAFDVPGVEGGDWFDGLTRIMDVQGGSGGDGGGTWGFADPLFAAGVTGFAKSGDLQKSVFQAFAVLGLELVHGWLFDPDENDLATEATLEDPHSSLTDLKTNIQTARRDIEEKEDELETLRAVALSNGKDADDDAACRKAADELDAMKTALEGRGKIQAFLDKTASSQLTSFGITKLKEHVTEGSVCILHRKRRFYTLTKRGDKLFVLATSLDHLNEEEIVWESLDREGEYVNRHFGTSARSGGASFFPQSMPSPQRLGGVRMDADRPLSDEELAMRLQREEQMYAMDPYGDDDAGFPFEMGDHMNPSTLAEAPAADGEPSTGGERPVLDRRWNVPLAVGLEIRSKVAFQDYLKTDSAESQSWEDWTRAANKVRAVSVDLRRIGDLPFDIVDKVRRECVAIMSGDRPVIPDDMREAATSMAVEEALMRREEHEFLVGELEGGSDGDEVGSEDGSDGSEGSSWELGSEEGSEEGTDRRERIQPSETLFVTNFRRETTTRNDLQALFEPHGELIRISMKGNYAFVEFRTGIEAKHARECTNGGTLDGNKITVEFASSRRRSKDRGDSSLEEGYFQCLKIQAAWRGFACRRDFSSMVSSITSIQAVSRGFLGRIKFRTLKELRRVQLLSSERIQAAARGRAVRKQYRHSINEGLAEWKRVQTQWKSVKDYPLSDIRRFSWASLKRDTFDMSGAVEEDAADNDLVNLTSQRITDAAANVVLSEDRDHDTVPDSYLEAPSTQEQSCFIDQKQMLDTYDNILLTHSVLKWLKAADPKYADFFRRRIRQLAAGERSRILQKHLTGCKHTIYETYLDQASAQRIIWTECREKGTRKGSILVWYVSKHKWVSRYIKQIDESEARMNRQFSKTAAHLFEDESSQNGAAMTIDADTILVDPMANVPLKIHQMPVADIGKLEREAFTPPLRLTTAEREVVETPGTVLLLGRSGTGKTICISNRIVYDAEFHRDESVLRQLFIARNARISRLVENLVSEELTAQARVETEFVSYKRILGVCEKSFNRLGIPSQLRPKHSQRFPLGVGFREFKDHFYEIVAKEMKLGLSPLVVWTQIRSYIKGSIEAVKSGQPLSEKEYLGLGVNRCRLDEGQRRKSYAAYQRYSQWLDSEGSFDSCDRIIDLLRRFGQASLDSRVQEKIRFDRIYVDECQDFTQSEIAFFWMLCERGSLFLAGDTAQSVEDGITFRFEEVRSVCHYLGGGNRRNVPDKPLSVTLNFRSHSGVLDLAAATLKVLLDAFPSAANKLPNDSGLFKGPRPSIVVANEENRLNPKTLQDIVLKNQGLVLLAPDENVEKVKETLGRASENCVVLGICEAKGLDFDEVCVVDFFSSLSPDQQKPWKELMRFAMNAKGAGSSWEMSRYPELEMRIKLLYTAITRCRHRLFFAETKSTVAGDSFIRWILGKELAEKQNIEDVSLRLKSPEEWKSLGVDYALNAESQETPDEASAWFKRAEHCFQCGGSKELIARAQTHSSIRSKASGLSQTDWNVTKETTPKVIELCLKEGFIEDAIELCELLLTDCPEQDNKYSDAVLSVLTKLKSLN